MTNTNNLKINLKTLRDFSNKLFDHLEEEGHSFIELESDYYWTFIDQLELYDPLNDPKNIGLGQLTDDYESMEKVVSGENEAVAYGAVWLSSILRFVGEKIMF